MFVVGNTDGDYAMLQYASTGEGAQFGLIVHHTDSLREVVHDRQSRKGQSLQDFSVSFTDLHQ